MNSIDILRNEHRAIAAVLSALTQLVDGIGTGRYLPDFELLEAMLTYIRDLPDKVHHPKEDEYLFKALRQRSADIGPVLDALEEEHREGPEQTLAVMRTLKRYRFGGPPEFDAFRDAVKAYIDAQWKHMSTEETQVLPLARQLLTPEDWLRINQAFASNDNPWEGAAGVYKKLFTRIVTMAPAPLGVGDPRRTLNPV